MRKIVFGLFVIATFYLLIVREGTLFDSSEATSSTAVYVERGGKMLEREAEKEKRPIASLTKVMTSYLVHEAVERGELTWDTSVTATEEMIVSQQGYASIGMRNDVTYTVRQLYDGMMIVSGNDAALGLAYALSGDEAQFVQRMNDKARELKLKETHFVNATGLDGEEVNVSSARDIARLATLHIERYPHLLQTTSRASYVSKEGITYWATNHLLPGMPFAVAGVDGLKTGYTLRAQDTFVVTGTWGGERYVAVMLGVPRLQPKETLKYEKMTQMLEEAVFHPFKK